MADKTVSFKIDENLAEKTNTIIKASGMLAKEWFEKAVALSELQSVKESAPDHASDLTEIETHTTRIYEIVSHIIQKSTYLRDHAVSELEKQLAQQREITSDYQLKVKEAIIERDQALKDLEASVKEQGELTNQLNEMREALETNKLLANQYKNNNDTLNGLVTKYQAYANENEQLKEALSQERNSHQSQIKNLTSQTNDQQSEIKALQAEISAMKQQHELELERTIEKKDLEHQKDLLQEERNHQKALTEANNEYTEKIRNLYEQLVNERKAYEQRIEQLQQEKDPQPPKERKK